MLEAVVSELMVVLQVSLMFSARAVALVWATLVNVGGGKMTEPHVGYAPQTMSVVMIFGPMPPTAWKKYLVY